MFDRNDEATQESSKLNNKIKSKAHTSDGQLINYVIDQVHAI
jgi:hypothetical protein